MPVLSVFCILKHDNYIALYELCVIWYVLCKCMNTTFAYCCQMYIYVTWMYNIRNWVYARAKGYIEVMLWPYNYPSRVQFLGRVNSGQWMDVALWRGLTSILARGSTKLVWWEQTWFNPASFFFAAGKLHFCRCSLRSNEICILLSKTIHLLNIDISLLLIWIFIK